MSFDAVRYAVGRESKEKFVQSEEVHTKNKRETGSSKVMYAEND